MHPIVIEIFAIAILRATLLAWLKNAHFRVKSVSVSPKFIYLLTLTFNLWSSGTVNEKHGGNQQKRSGSALFELSMLHSSLMRWQHSVLFCKYLTAVSACLSSCLVPEQTAAGLTNHLPSGGQHFSIFKALILNFTVSVLHFSESDHVHTTADKFENAVYIWKFMSTLAFSGLF